MWHRTSFSTVPYAQDPSRDYTFAVRTVGQPGLVARSVRLAVAQTDPELALFDVKTMDERTALSMSSRRASLMLALAFGGLGGCVIREEQPVPVAVTP